MSFHTKFTTEKSTKLNINKTLEQTLEHNGIPLRWVQGIIKVGGKRKGHSTNRTSRQKMKAV